jgi:hypothetical protein
MKVELKNIRIREIARGYKDDAEEGVKGYNGKLDIRPKYQREFVYKDKQRDAVIDTITKDFPLNVMYWAVNKDEKFEMIDGQQRTISFCQYINNEFMIDGKYWDNLTKEEKNKILNYKVMIYFCSGGTDREKLDWFRTVNIAGEKLFEQELRNATYSGQWVTDAKRYFSRRKCVAFEIGSRYLDGNAIRQDYLETAIQWISDGNIEEYMAKHQNESSATDLWLYFQKAINWVEALFPTYRKEMKGVPWGDLYKEFGTKMYDPKILEEEIMKHMMDEDVTNKKGIYSYVLTGKEKFLNIRAFSDRQKREAYERQKGICPGCNKKFEMEEMEGDHIKLWSKGGKTEAANCQMLCTECNREKSKK